MNSIRALMRRSPLVSFFGLAFILSWGAGAAIKGTPLLAPDGSFVAGVLIAALIVAVLVDGWAGLGDLGRRLLRWRVAPGWYAVVLLLPVLTVATLAGLLQLFDTTPLDWTKQPELAATALLFVVLMVLPVAAPVSEEIGWRGYALPRLLASRSALTASLVLGVIWSLWHLPVVLSDPVLRVPVPFLLQVIPTSVIFTWIFLHTRGSVFIALLFHAWFDVVLAYAGAMIAPSDYELMWWLLVAIQTGLAVVVLAIWGRNLVRRPSAGAEARTTAAEAA
jgi:membrane protease YdiL (CAAX protease family)